MRIVIILIAWRTPRNVPRPAGNSSNEAKKPRGIPVPHSNFARNSPSTLSNFEVISLKFRGFRDIANLSDYRITCEINDERLKGSIPELRRVPRRSQCPRFRFPNAHRRATPTHAGRHAHPIDEHARTIIRFTEILRSVDEHSRHNGRILTACAHI